MFNYFLDLNLKEISTDLIIEYIIKLIDNP
jgi:hypothetical protein